MDEQASEVFLTAPQVRQRYGNKSDMWLWRVLREEPEFPKPIVIRKQRYFRLCDLIAYEDACRREAA
jgi:predicted DNA-binding transcriptional regulator AlpA